MGLGMWILRNKAKYPPEPSQALWVLPLLFADSALISVFSVVLLSFFLKAESDTSIFFMLLAIFIITIYLLRAHYLGVSYNILLFFIKRNGKNQIERILIRTLKYCLIMYIHIPIFLLLIQSILWRIQYTFLWASLPFTYFYVSLIITVIVAVSVEYSLSEKTFEKVDEIYDTPKRGGLLA